VIPAMLLTGFLGAGKTTALNQLMNARPDLRVGVIENEAGTDDIDSDLLHGAARVIEVTGGCACCTVRGALTSALELLGDRADELDLVIVEASGIADPVPIVQAFQSPSARNAFRFRGIVCVIDAAAVATGEPRPRVWDLQVRLAGHIIVSKKDLLNESELEFAESRILDQARDAGVIAGLDDPAFVKELLGSPEASLPEVLRHEDSEPGHGFTAHSLRVPAELKAGALDRWLSDLLRRPGVFRVKGTVGIEGMSRRYVIQGTPQLLDLYPESSTGRSRRSRLVVIGTDIDARLLQAELNACAGKRLTGTHRTLAASP